MALWAFLNLSLSQFFNCQRGSLLFTLPGCCDVSSEMITWKCHWDHGPWDLCLFYEMQNLRLGILKSGGIRSGLLQPLLGGSPSTAALPGVDQTV